MKKELSHTRRERKNHAVFMFKRKAEAELQLAKFGILMRSFVPFRGPTWTKHIKAFLNQEILHGAQ